MKEVVILNGARTPMAEYAGSPHGGLFADLSAIELAALASKEALKRSNVQPAQIGHSVFGNALQTSADAIYGARHVALKAGVPIEKPALTVNRLCGSGIQSLISGAQMIQLGHEDFVLAGGMENMSQAPHVLRGARKGLRFGPGAQLEDLLFASLKDPYCDLFMAQTADKLGKKYQISREEQDAYALRSVQCAVTAAESGVLSEEILPITVKRRKKSLVVDRDDHMRPDTTLEDLSSLRSAFGKDSTITAGNASGIVDGAAAVVLTHRASAEQYELPWLAAIKSWAIFGVDPSIMGIGPAPAIRLALKYAGLTLDQVDLFEINEAFAAQYLAVERELGLDRNRVNVNGGAIALGHPLGATGTRMVLTLALELRRREARYGVASACIGGGQGIALVIEAAS